MTEKPVVVDGQSKTVSHEPTQAQVDSACLSFSHDFGLLAEGERNQLRFMAREWLTAWQKEGFGCDRNEVIERCAAVVDRANREGPYQAIASASRIRELKSATRPSLPAPGREEIEKFLRAWDSLPIGTHSPSTVERWLGSPEMKDGIRGLRVCAAKEPAHPVERGALEKATEALQEVADFMRKDVQSGDSDLWTPAYESMHDDVIVALQQARAALSPSNTAGDGARLRSAGLCDSEHIKQILTVHFRTGAPGEIDAINSATTALACIIPVVSDKEAGHG